LTQSFPIRLDDLPPSSRKGFPWSESSEIPPPQYLTGNLPKITIITPSFNQGQFIEQTIRSVLLQGYPNLEYIIIDGGSTDETVEIIKKYADFITYWVSEPDKGQSPAINKGLAVATGDVFNWLNSDDYFLPNALLTVGQHFAEYSNSNVFCGQLYGEFPDGRLKHIGGLSIGRTVEESLTSHYYYQQSTFFRLPIVKQLGGISDALFFCMDLELWINYLTHFGYQGIDKSDKSLAVFRLHDDAKTHKSQVVRHSDHINLFLCLIDSSDIKASFLSKFIRDNIVFDRYFHKNYPLNQVNQKKLCGGIAERLLDYYCQYLSWHSFFLLYFYSFKLRPFQPFSRRFYFLPFIKIKRLFRPI
jgi:glycosyltransferase involved in cell wall biosynthesis